MRKTLIAVAMVLGFVVSAGAASVGHWLAEGNADDSSIYGNHGLLVGDTAYVTGRAGWLQAFSFDGDGDYVSVAYDSSLQLSSEVTMATWVRRTRLDDVDIIMERGGTWGTHVGGGSTNYGMGLNLPANDHMFYAYYGAHYWGVSGLTDDDWHFYVATARAGDAAPHLYIDGVEQLILYTNAGGSNPVSLAITGANLHIGAQPDVNDIRWSASEVDEAWLYDEALGASAVRAQYDATKPVPEPGAAWAGFLLLAALSALRRRRRQG